MSTLQPDLAEARRLLGAGLKLTKLKRFLKVPEGNDWNLKPVREIEPAATGYGIILASNKLCSIDPDHVDLARVGVAACGFDLEAWMAAGVRTRSTRKMSGGRSTFAQDGEIGWVKFKCQRFGIVLELRADSPNLQDTVPGIVYRDKDGNLCTQQYANCRRLDDAPGLPDDLLVWWERLTNDIEFRHGEETKFFKAIADSLGLNLQELDYSKAISAGRRGQVKLAFSAPGYRQAYNAAHTVEEHLERHGYTWHRRLKRWSHPGATGSPGIYPVPGKNGELWRSDHGGDPLSGAFDAWSAFVLLDHKGDLEAAKLACETERIILATSNAARDMGAKGADEQPLTDQPAAEKITLAQMLRRFVHVTKGPLVIDRGLSRNIWRPHEFVAKYAHVTDGKKAITTEWFAHPHRIVVDDLTFDPAEGEYPVLQSVRYFNLWREPQHDATLATPGGAAPFVDHIKYLIPDPKEASDFIDYLAHCVQFPGVRPHFHFLLVTAATGTGRGWVGALLRRLLGRKYAVETDLHRLIADNFNDILSGAITLVCNEVRAPANERFSQKDRLKSLLTDEVIEINPKYQPRRIEKLCARFLMLTNREDALPLDESDRRVYAVGCADRPRSPSYYVELYGRLNDPSFVASVWAYLKGRDLSAFNPGMRAPLNAMKAQLIESGRTDEQQDAVEFVRVCPWDVIYSSDLYRAILGADENDPDRRHKVQSVGAVLREIGVQSFPRKVKADDGTTQRAFILRQQGQWRTALPARVREVATACRRDLKADFFDRCQLIERWTK